MAKPRIIIADTDRNYILSLQQKFVEEFFEKADLEIITDAQYFAELFSAPQRAEILIFSEDLYDMSLQKHNIAHMFLMAEQEEEGETVDLSVDRIYKYTSIMEIFGEIIGKSADVLQKNAGETKETQIILVTSAAGGVGKTTIAMGLSAVLSKRYKRVLYLNTDQLQSFQRLLQNQTPITGNDVYAGLLHADTRIYSNLKYVVRQELFRYLPPFKAGLLSLGMIPTVFRQIAVSAKNSGEYDFIFIDTDNTFDENKAALMDLADKVIFVTGQNAASVEATNILVANINGIDNDKYLFLCNNFSQEAENALISPQIALKFRVNEYVEHLNHYDQMKGIDFAAEKGFQKAAYLLE